MSQARDDAIRRLRATKVRMKDSPSYSPKIFDFGVELLQNGAAFTVRRSTHGLQEDEILIDLGSRGSGAMLPLMKREGV